MTGYLGSISVPRGIRNDNPTNIRHSIAQRWVGELDPDPDGFCRFTDPIHGLRAAYIIFRDYQRYDRVNTVGLMIARWAPAVENRTLEYIDDVCTRTKLTPEAPVDLVNKGIPWLRAIVWHECGEDPYLDIIYSSAILAATLR